MLDINEITSAMPGELVDFSLTDAARIRIRFRQIHNI